MVHCFLWIQSNRLIKSNKSLIKSLRTTHDLDDYYAQLKQIPRLSDEERHHHHVLTTLALSHQVRDTSSPDILQAARHRLIEGHLNLATYVAVQECPPSRYRLLPDLVGAVNLALVEAMRRCNLNDTHDLTSYLAANVRGTIKRVIGDESLIHTPSSTRSVARAKGTVDRLYAFETVSFDVAMHPFDDDDLREPLTSPLLPTEAAPPRDPALRAQVEEWLALLTPRAQAVLRLRYGLSDDNERAHTTAEIAHLLGIRRQAVQQAEREALQRLRALMAGEASVSTMAGKPRIRRGKPQQERVASAHHRTYCALTPAEQEERLMQTALRLCEQGSGVTLRRLARETGIPIYRVQAFLQAHREMFPAETQARKHQHSLEQVAQVYAQLIAQGQQVTSSKKLARAAHVRIDTALELLHAKRSQQHEIV
jgi:RNA polymerase sigma factor (sigma-70 family)